MSEKPKGYVWAAVKKGERLSGPWHIVWHLPSSRKYQQLVRMCTGSTMRDKGNLRFSDEQPAKGYCVPCKLGYLDEQARLGRQPGTLVAARPGTVVMTGPHPARQ